MGNRIGIFALLTGASCAICGTRGGAGPAARRAAQRSVAAGTARDRAVLRRHHRRGYDGNEVVIVADAPIRDADGEEPPREDGLRRIQSSSVGLTVEENDNTVSVRMDFSPKNADIEIRVPRRTSVKASLVNGGDVEITGLTGEHELSNVNGDVIATDLTGSAVINATNGDVRATFTSVDATKPMSFTSFNGDVDVTLPGKPRGRLDRGEPAGRRLHGLRGPGADRSAERPAAEAAPAAAGKSAGRSRAVTRSAAAAPTSSCGPSTAT